MKKLVFGVILVLGVLLGISGTGQSMMSDYSPGDGQGPPHAGGGGEVVTGTHNFTGGLALGDHHTQYPNALNSMITDGAYWTITNTTALRRIMDIDNAQSDCYGSNPGWYTEHFNDTSVNTTTYPKQLLPPIGNTTINKVYAVCIMEPKYGFADPTTFKFWVTLNYVTSSDVDLRRIDDIHYHTANIYPNGTRDFAIISYSWPMNSIRMVEYYWDISTAANWTAEILRNHVQVLIIADQALTGGGGGSLVTVDYTGLSYNWTYGIHSRYEESGGGFHWTFDSKGLKGIFGVIGFGGMVAIPAMAIIYAKRSSDMDGKAKAIVSMIVAFALCFALLMTGLA